MMVQIKVEKAHKDVLPALGEQFGMQDSPQYAGGRRPSRKFGVLFVAFSPPADAERRYPLYFPT